MTIQLRADWLKDAKVQAVMAALNAAKPGCARFVGGCVRNAIMKRGTSDIDIATQLEPAASMAALDRAGVRHEPTGIDHGTITAILDGTAFEITSLRKDVETDGRRAVVAFTEDWEEDAQRRDFRLNALYASAEGDVFDPTGKGVEDARAGRVVFVGDPDTRLKEDYLRILRFFRFNAWYGAEIGSGGVAACERQKDGLEGIASERIWSELKKLLTSPDIAALRSSVAAMKHARIFEVILPFPVSLDGLDQVLLAENGGGPCDEPVRRLMGLMRNTPEAAARVSEVLKLSNAETKRLKNWASDGIRNLRLSSKDGLYEALYWHGEEAVFDRAVTNGMTSLYFYSDILKWERPVFPLNGDDALEAGLKGPEIGTALKRLEEDWVKGGFKATREDLLSRLT